MIPSPVTPLLTCQPKTKTIMKNLTTVRSFRTMIAVAMLRILVVACTEEQLNPALTREFTIHSAINDGDYKITVALPEGYSPSKTYSTLYVLDAEGDFAFVANQCSKISAANGTGNVLVVGIGYGNPRDLDYTPTSVSLITGGAP